MNRSIENASTTTDAKAMGIMKTPPCTASSQTEALPED